MALIHDNLDWLQNGEPVTGGVVGIPRDGVMNRPLIELLENDAGLELRLAAVEGSSGGYETRISTLEGEMDDVQETLDTPVFDNKIHINVSPGTSGTVLQAISKLDAQLGFSNKFKEVTDLDGAMAVALDDAADGNPYGVVGLSGVDDSEVTNFTGGNDRALLMVIFQDATYDVTIKNNSNIKLVGAKDYVGVNGEILILYHVYEGSVWVWREVTRSQLAVNYLGIGTLPAGNTTPSIAGKDKWKAVDATPTIIDITNFLNGQDSKEITILFTDNFTRIKHQAGLIELLGSLDFLGSPGTALTLVYDLTNTKWVETGRSWRLSGGYETPFSTSSKQATINHSLGYHPAVQVLDASGYVVVPLSIQHTSTNTVVLTFASDVSSYIAICR